MQGPPSSGNVGTGTRQAAQDERDGEQLAVFGPESWGGTGAASGRGVSAPPLAAFLTAAHELRAPLAWLLGEVESLRAQTSGPLNSEQLTITRQIADTCVRMQRIVEDCFAYGRLENGEMSFHADLADADALMRDLATAWAPAFEKKGVQLIAHPKGKLEPFACDPHKLLRIISILLENALKFTRKGGTAELIWQPCIWARGDTRADDEGRRIANAAHFSVRDTGPGIAPENQLEIFEPFVSLTRGDAEAIMGIPPGQGGFRRRKDDAAPGLGLGLGLAVARRLVQWHGGKIWVESNLNHGSTFSVMLPLRP